MGWKQVRTPNFDPVIYQEGKALDDWVGMCLAYVQTAYGADWSGPTALVSWQGGTYLGVRYPNSITLGRHADKNVPKGVWLPLHYSGWGQFGHVLIAKFNADGSGVAFTSPNDSKPAADKITFSSLENLTQQLVNGWAADIRYLGWSEYIGPTRVIKFEKEEKMITLQQLNYLYLALFGEKPNANAIKTNVGKRSFAETEKVLTKSALFKQKQELAAKGELDPTAFLPRALKLAYKAPAKAVVAQVEPTTLKPGLYEVK